MHTVGQSTGAPDENVTAVVPPLPTKRESKSIPSSPHKGRYIILDLLGIIPTIGATNNNSYAAATCKVPLGFSW